MMIAMGGRREVGSGNKRVRVVWQSVVVERGRVWPWVCAREWKLVADWGESMGRGWGLQQQQQAKGGAAQEVDSKHCAGKGWATFPL